ncbi:MAG: hypothetical protein V7K53_10130 [Nostoc sp.]|uniref:hypothetical protein n=1 Tax=Nostoc sp. TaxID=1180 RepID=UPI002FF7D60B
MTNTQGYLIKRFYWVRDGDRYTFANRCGQQRYLAQVRNIGSTEWDLVPELRQLLLAMPAAGCTNA